MNSYKIGWDCNGNKVVKVKPAKGRGFSIQTNGNLPLTHKRDVGTWTDGEVKRHVAAYGTVAQRKALFMETAEEVRLNAYRKLHDLTSELVGQHAHRLASAPTLHLALITALTDCCNADPEV